MPRDLRQLRLKPLPDLVQVLKVPQRVLQPPQRRVPLPRVPRQPRSTDLQRARKPLDVRRSRRAPRRVQRARVPRARKQRPKRR